MKNKTFRLLGLSTVFASALLVGLSSCKKDKDNNTGNQVSATIGTQTFTSSGVTAFSTSGYIDILAYQPKSQDTSFIEFYLPDTATVNSKYRIEDGIAEYSYFNFKQTFDYGSSSRSHGTITFTTVDKAGKRIAGNFSGVLYQSSTDSVVVKDGKFNTTYITF
jgi:hypothetical protein